ncbi:M28 family peptidase, partial [candidate division GN15 bacterium]|nr:M28 family peptidase [candidate division GN15 bacterium]
SGSRYMGEEKKIHYGADDNGSGVAALLELGRTFAGRSEPMDRSVMFVAFSGEEAGLLGSSHLVRHWPIKQENAYMMINMDMIGRLNNQEKGLMIMGTGTSTEFKAFFEDFEDSTLKMTFTESGAGPSDHSAFYNDSIPVLHFFTGAHQDYHTPDDVIDKVDFAGVQTVTNMVASIVDTYDHHEGRLSFERTKDVMGKGHRASFSVTLGIMPDYMSEVQGLRIDGVSPERPADNAGMIKGDVIIQLGDLTIGDIYDYMNALSRFRKDDVVDALVVREADTLSLTVEFK